ncbi:MAG TPA: lyase family protein [Bacteroidales bacterium]|nr:lyase family protein [Bacteroidales bacterium]
MSRIEKDSLGEKEIPSGALYGIHAARASENFPANMQFPVEWYEAVGIVKSACYKTYQKFRKAAEAKLGPELPFRHIGDSIINALISSSSEVSEGRYYDQFIVPAIQGGAGTSINMNINEIIANVALLKTGKQPGDYDYIDPTEHANIYQSTNDVIPTALTISVLKLLQELEEEINKARQITENLEKKFRYDLRPGYTQMQEAVPSSFGILFSTYNDALSRDWWRISRISERVKQVNLGGGATGTGLSQPRFFILEVIPELRSLTGLALAHGENLPDTTANLDKWVELHAILKTSAVNFEKITGDLRLLASDLAGRKTIMIPEKQVGSSIMPGKINPVIPEFIISAAHRIYSNDMLISSLSGQGVLDLNAYLPVIGYSLIESIKLLISICITFNRNLVTGLVVNTKSAFEMLLNSPSVTTALVPYIGYHKSALLANLMKERNINILEANRSLNLVDYDRLEKILTPSNLLKTGFSLDDLA